MEYQIAGIIFLILSIVACLGALRIGSKNKKDAFPLMILVIGFLITAINSSKHFNPAPSFLMTVLFYLATMLIIYIYRKTPRA